MLRAKGAATGAGSRGPAGVPCLFVLTDPSATHRPSLVWAVGFGTSSPPPQLTDFITGEENTEKQGMEASGLAGRAWFVWFLLDGEGKATLILCYQDHTQ